jgi:enoyl-CoA hydratase/carnithine racemase
MTRVAAATSEASAMSTDEPLVLVEVDEGVATLTLNSPQSVNAMSVAMHDVLLAQLKRLNPGDDVRVIRLRGAGRAFCAGADMSTIYDGFREPDDVREGDAWQLGEGRASIDREFLRTLAERHLWMWSYRKPIVAQVHGYCVAGGIELIGNCDVIFAADDARFGHPPSRAHGIPVTLGQWPFRIGMLRTKEMLFTGDLIDGTAAKEMGMVNHAVPADELDQTTLEFCQRIAKAPLDALTISKHATNRWFENAGIRSSVTSGADLDSLWHTGPAFESFVKIASEEGLKSALAWRDKPFTIPTIHQ